MKNKEKFSGLMTTLGEIHNRQISDLLMEIYWRVLEPYDDNECEIVFNKLIHEARFFPKPPDFIEMLAGEETDRTMEAWLKVVEGIRRYGNYQSVSFDDPVIHSCIEVMGGWVKVCEVLESDLKWREKEFLRLYPIMRRRDKHPQYLVGQHEIENANKGLNLEKAIAMLGFEKKTKVEIE